MKKGIIGTEKVGGTLTAGNALDAPSLQRYRTRLAY